MFCPARVGQKIAREVGQKIAREVGQNIAREVGQNIAREVRHAPGVSSLGNGKALVSEW